MIVMRNYILFTFCHYVCMKESRVYCCILPPNWNSRDELCIVIFQFHYIHKTVLLQSISFRNSFGEPDKLDLRCA